MQLLVALVDRNMYVASNDAQSNIYGRKKAKLRSFIIKLSVIPSGYLDICILSTKSKEVCVW